MRFSFETEVSPAAGDLIAASGSWIASRMAAPITSVMPARIVNTKGMLTIFKVLIADAVLLTTNRGN